MHSLTGYDELQWSLIGTQTAWVPERTLMAMGFPQHLVFIDPHPYLNIVLMMRGRCLFKEV
jgi:hypothetical protein